MSETNDPKSEPTIWLAGDLPPIHSDEFGEFLAQWHTDHNGSGRPAEHTKPGTWAPVDAQIEMAC